jgi:hypothetical protein
VTAPWEGAILTLEPLMEAVRRGVEEVGWELSGLQKTTSHQFEGRWEGESTRSAYLFFHAPSAPEPVSVDVYLDETTRGLTGNLALVVDLLPLQELGDPAEALRVLGALSSQALPANHAAPLTLRLRLEDGSSRPGLAESEVRFKLRLPKSTIADGAGAVRTLAASTVAAFERILAAPELARYLADD